MYSLLLGRVEKLNSLILLRNLVIKTILICAETFNLIQMVWCVPVSICILIRFNVVLAEQTRASLVGSRFSCNVCTPTLPTSSVEHCFFVACSLLGGGEGGLRKRGEPLNFQILSLGAYIINAVVVWLSNLRKIMEININ